jgi:AcrR family transcriptional regulator
MAHPLHPVAPVVGAAVPPGRRERKKLATRAAVQAAALRLSVRHGVENVTIEQIAAEADIAVRTFYIHFSSKEEAVTAPAATGVQAFVAEFRARPPGESVLQALRETVLVAMPGNDIAGRDYLQALRLMRDAPSLLPHRMAVLAAQEDALAAAITERIGPDPPPSTESRAGGPGAPASTTGSGRPDPRVDRSVYPRLCAAAALAALRIVLDRWIDHLTGPDDLPPPCGLREEIDEALSYLAAGFDQPQPGTPQRSTSVGRRDRRES